MKPKLHHYIHFPWNNIYQNESNFLGFISTESENACNDPAFYLGLFPRITRDNGRSDARLLVQKMKQDTKIQQVPIKSIIMANGLQSLSEEKAVRLALPCRSAINRALNRQKINERPTLPPIVDRHFEVPKQHEDFCVFDSGIEDPERVSIFGDRDNIQSLILHRDVWLCDRTFKACPIQFYQIYTIHIQLAGFYPPPPPFMHCCQTKQSTLTKNY